MPLKVSHEVKRAMRIELEAIDRLDLIGKKEFTKYWCEEEDATIEGCVEFLLNLFPEKKIYKYDILDDPYDQD